MCGIVGYIGESYDPNLTHQLTTFLLEETEIRGRDATGYWGTEKGNGKILYHKEPLKPTDFLRKKLWKKLGKHKPNLLLVHAREASPNVGCPSININNHPFISSDKATALIHNGRIQEFDFLCKKYETISSCDSEILLRIFEAQSGNELEGIADIWRLVTQGHMAVAIGQRLGDKRLLWLFRNPHRTLWVIDCREILGQIFFASTEDIWHYAIKRCPQLKKERSRIPLYELPPYEIWKFEINSNEPVVTEKLHEIYEVQKGSFTPWKHDGPRLPVLQRDAVTEVITYLNELDEDESEDYLPWPPKKKSDETYNLPNGRLNDVCNKIRYVTNDIETMMMNNQENFSYNEYERVISELESAYKELQFVEKLCEN